MDTRLPLYKKMMVLVRLEPGCLGPDGVDHIEGFCQFAKPILKQMNKSVLRWQIEPRYDKTLPEVEYQMKGNTLSEAQAEQFLSVFEMELEQFQEDLDERLAELIEQYSDRQ